MSIKKWLHRQLGTWFEQRRGPNGEVESQLPRNFFSNSFVKGEVQLKNLSLKCAKLHDEVEGLPAKTHRHFSSLEPAAQQTVAWLTQQQASARATISFIAEQDTAPRPPTVSLKVEAPPPGQGGAQVCLAPNTEMQTNDGCALL